jgi:hypothetical protein
LVTQHVAFGQLVLLMVAKALYPETHGACCRYSSLWECWQYYSDQQHTAQAMVLC